MIQRRPSTARTPRERETQELIARKETDLARWSEADGLAEQWEMRATMAAEWIPAGVRVLDVGCGAMLLGALLKPSCSYFPADVIERRPGCFVADLNRRQFPPGAYDWVTLLGVLEYIHDFAWVLTRAVETAPNLLATYCTSVEGDLHHRRSKGWVNDLTMHEFAAVLQAAGWKPDRVAEVNRGIGNVQIMVSCHRRG